MPLESLDEDLKPEENINFCLKIFANKLFKIVIMEYSF